MWLLILIVSHSSFQQTLACLIHCQVTLMVSRLCILPLQTVHVNVSIRWLLLISCWICVTYYNLAKIFNTLIRCRRWWAVIYSISLSPSLRTVCIKIQVSFWWWQHRLMSDGRILIVCIPELTCHLLLPQLAQFLFDLGLDVLSAYTQIVYAFFRIIEDMLLAKRDF